MSDHAAPHTHRIIIIGAGFSGIGMAIRLRERGVDDFVILERASDLGGTWRDNRYPGCACDVQSALYSFSFAPNAEWSSVFSPQAEIWNYLKACAQRFDIMRHLRFRETVSRVAWLEHEQQWVVTSSTQQWHAPQVILASGALSDPVTPAIAGLGGFAGKQFHSAQWDHSYDLRGKRVAVIGTGASAIQFVPRIQAQVESLHLFQRTPPWIMPRHDHAIPSWRRALYRAVPAAQTVARATLYAQRELMFVPFRHRAVRRFAEWSARRHMESQVRDPALRARLLPTYGIGCKRVLLSDNYYPAIAQPNVSLVTDAIVRVHADGIEMTDGRHHAVDTIIFGTGFRPTDPPLAPFVIGRHGTTLAEQWRGSPQAYWGTTVAGFPNFALLLGPNTGLGHTSILLVVEAQIEHVLKLMDAMARHDAATVEPTAAAQSRFVEWCNTALSGTVWNSGGCDSWYLDRTGRNSALWPYRVGRFMREASRLRESDYEFRPRRVDA